MQQATVTRIMNAMETMMRVSSVARSLETIKRYSIDADHIDEAILAAINASLCLVSDGDNRVAEGFNDDIARNGRRFAAA